MSNNSMYNENSRKAPERAFSRVASEVIVNTIMPVTSEARYYLQQQVRAMYPEDFFPAAVPQVTEAPEKVVVDNVVNMADYSVAKAQRAVEDAYFGRDVDLRRSA